MLSYIIRRLSLGIIVLLGVITITFTIARIIPSDPAVKWAGPRATQEQIQKAREQLGLDKPLIVQFWKYLTNCMKGDLGYSLRTHQPIKEELKTFIPATLELVIIAFIFATIVGIPLGIYSAKMKDQLLDHLSRLFSIGAVSLPTFWVGLFLQLIFYNQLELLPLGGQVSTEIKIMYEIPKVTGMLLFDCILTSNWIVFFDALKHYILPCFTIALYPIGLVARMTRSALLEVLNEDYIIAAKSYGLKDRKVLWIYALKNTLGSTAIVLTLSLGYTLVDTFLVEAIFSWPGLGSYVTTAVTTLDYPAIIGVTIFSTVCYVILNLVADIIIALDPRVRL
ncbi:MAG: ABC transporter permease [Clostridiales bacterium]|nr:ABC transporter permease [Clostridiales bacterium]